MKNYNKSFKVEITANMISEKMMNTIMDFATQTKDGTVQHKAEKLVDTVIGPMVSNDNLNGLKHLYYGLFDLDIEAPLFKESDELFCDATQYHYVAKQKAGMQEGDEMETEYVREREAIGHCKLIGFDPYRNDEKYQIQYQEMDRTGDISLTIKWVNNSELGLHSDNVDDNISE